MRNLKIFESPRRARKKLAAMAVLGLAAAGVGAVVLGSASAATTRVVDDNGADCPGAPYTSIQTAINDSAIGDTVQVCAGTYTENLNLAKDITLLGARAGVDARGRVGAESIVNGTGIKLEFDTGAADATVDGFTFTGGPPLGSGVLETDTGPLNGLSLLNNRVVGFTSSGIFLNDPGSNITIDQTVVDGSSKTGGGGLVHLDTDAFDGFQMTNSNVVNGAGATGLFSDGTRNVGSSTTRDPLLDGNLFDGNRTGANLGRFSFEFADITNNTFSNNGNGLPGTGPGLQGGPADSLISGNVFDDNALGGLELTGFGGGTTPTRGAQRNTIENNEFTSNGTGIFFSSSQFAGTISTNVAHQNNIVGNTVGASYAGTETINMECNWWGDDSGPMHSANPGGTGDSVVDDGNGIDYVNWLIEPAPSTQCLGPLSTKQEKQLIRDNLAAMLPTGDKHDDHEIEKAIEHIDKSLEPENWVDDEHLDAKKGHKVFDEEKAAVGHLEHVDTVDVTAEMDGLVGIDRDLAETAISEIPPTATNPKRQKKVDEETAKANEELAKGDAEAADGDRKHAIERYKHAWEHAQHATEEANKA